MQVTHSHGGAVFESADGKYLYFISEGTNELFRTPVGGGEEKQVAPVVLAWYGFSVTVNGVYFFSDSKTLQLLDEKTGLIHTAARLEGHSALEGMTVSSDATSLVFAELNQYNRSDLMLVEGFR